MRIAGKENDEDEKVLSGAMLLSHKNTLLIFIPEETTSFEDAWLQ